MPEIRLNRLVWTIVAVVIALGWLRAGLFFADVVGPYTTGMRYINFGMEQSLPTWTSAMLFALGAGLALLARRAAVTPFERMTWLLVAVTLLFLSLDEALSIHENFYRVVQALGLASEWTDGLTYRWLALAVPLLMVVAAVGLPMLWRLPRETAIALIAGAVVFFSGSVGGEALAGALLDGPDPSPDSKLLAVVSSVEETLELLGAGLITLAVAGHLRRHAPVRLDLTLGGPGHASRGL